MTIDRARVCLLGVPDLDDDHLHLVDMAERISGDLAEGSYELCVRLFEEFQSAAEGHFRREEAMLERLGYQGLAQHAAYHDELISRVRTLKALGYAKTSKEAMLLHYESMVAFVLDDIVRGDLELLACLRGAGDAGGAGGHGGHGGHGGRGAI